MATPAQIMRKEELSLDKLAKLGVVEKMAGISIDIGNAASPVFFQKKGGIPVRVNAETARKLVRG